MECILQTIRRRRRRRIKPKRFNKLIGSLVRHQNLTNCWHHGTGHMFHNQPFIMRRAIWRHIRGYTDSHTIKPTTAGVQLVGHTSRPTRAVFRLVWLSILLQYSHGRPTVAYWRFHTEKWPLNVNRRRAPGVIRLGFNGYDITIKSLIFLIGSLGHHPPQFDTLLEV